VRGKYYTIMVVPHTRARFTQLRVSATFVVSMCVIAAAAVVSAGLLPVYVHLTIERGTEIQALHQENQDLRAAGVELDASISALRDRVGYFETEATKFALMAGVEDLPSAQPVGGARETPPATASLGGIAPVSTDRLIGEMETLQERAIVLRRSCLPTRTAC
jgi:hypothetical protein